MKIKIFKIMFAIYLISFTGLSFAHEGGHGPAVTDTGSFGGIIAAVIEAKDEAKGEKAVLVYKAELTRAADKTVRVYIYSKDMKLLSANQLNSQAEAKIISKISGKEITKSFPLVFENNAYVGKMPEPAGKPYNIDILFTSDGKNLLAPFDGLD